MSNRIVVEGSYAPTENELLQTSDFLNNVIAEWPKVVHADAQAVKRFANKLDCLCYLHDLRNELEQTEA